VCALYAGSTYFRLFREELLAGREGDLVNNPPAILMTFTFELKSVGRQGPQWKDAIVLDKYLRGDAARYRLSDLQSVRRSVQMVISSTALDPEKPETQYRVPAQLAISPQRNRRTGYWPFARCAEKKMRPSDCQRSHGCRGGRPGGRPLPAQKR
jgi:hypothetical protein